jgi:ubiquinone/menaquinone biosynthesis C-methylase UbiE
MDIIEKKYVHDIYDKIALHFDQTRQYIWAGVQNFINEMETGSLIADIGCGNGKNMTTRSDCKFVGCDSSIEFVNICIEKKLNCIQANILNIPFKDNMFDYTLCIAVIHHLSTSALRKTSVDELIRITAPGGLIFVQVWHINQQKKKSIKLNEADDLVPWTLQKRYETGGKKEYGEESNNVKKDSNNDKILYRFYHYFQEGELEELFDLDRVQIVKSFIEMGNLCLIAKKL